jgi:DNA-binding NarL/FixJ family response regulator
MPRGTGLDVLKNVKHDGHGPRVVVFTNFPYPQYRKRALEYGADFFLDKTTEFEKLREVFHHFTGLVAAGTLVPPTDPYERTIPISGAR